MPSNITMPRLSDTMEVGTIVKWHIKPGAKVKSGDVIADIETDKATMELQTFEDGVVAELAIKEGASAPVGTPIVVFEGGSASASKNGPAASKAAASDDATRDDAHASQRDSATATAPRQPDAPHRTHTRDGERGDARVFASPLARKTAQDSGIDLKAIEGSGPGGRIILKDVEAAIAGGTSGNAAPAPARSGAGSDSEIRGPSSASRGPTHPAAAAVVPGAVFTHAVAPLEGRTVQLSNMRATIAKRLVESKTTIPHYQVTVTVRLDALLALRQQLNDQLAPQGVKLSVNDFLVRACALGMHAHPFVNSRWVPAPAGGTPAIEILPAVNVGVAVALPEEKGGGLVVATIRQADSKGLRQISSQTKALAEKARTRGLTVEEMADSTFTISNLGMFGVSHFTAIINPPNAAILAVGAAEKKAIVETEGGKDTIVIGHEMQMTMSSDHRIVDGAMAAAYLGSVKAMLEKPATLLV
ncbi:MAG: dihydrolipoamide acetyltransferase family protein [Phycisphaerales bacterium]